MSTKTSIKRIALVAVSALGFGVLGALTPAQASVTPTAVSVGTLPVTAIGIQSTIPVSVTAPLTAATTDAFLVTVKVISAPTGSAFVGTYNRHYVACNSATPGDAVVTPGPPRVFANSIITGICAAGNSVEGALSLDSSTSATVGTVITTEPTPHTNLTPEVSAQFTEGATGDTTVGSAARVANILFTPDIAGSYQFLVSTKIGTTSAVDASYAAGDANTTFIVTTGSTPASVTMATIGSAPIVGSTNGQLFTVSLKDAAGNAATLGLNQTLTITSSSANGRMFSVNPDNATEIQPGGGTGAATLTLNSSSFVEPGTAYVKFWRVTDTAAATTVLTAAGSGLLSASINNTLSITTVLTTASTNVTLANPTGATRPGSDKVGIVAVGAPATAYTDISSRSATSHSYAVTNTVACTADATSVILSSLTDTTGLLTGVVSAVVDGPAITLTCNAGGTASTGSVTVSGALALNNSSFALQVGTATNTTTSKIITVTANTAVVASLTASPVNALRLATGGSVALTGRVVDQFGVALANRAVTVAVAGRNATSTAVNLATDSTGRVSYTLTDASTSTVNLVDTVTFTAADVTAQVAGANVVTVNYGTFTPNTITLTGGNTTASVENASETINPISAANGVEAGAITFTATVRDANGALLTGVPVTFSVDSANAAVRSTTQTVYTSSAGTAAASVYAWIAGKYTVTATAGTKSTTGTMTWASTTATNARVVSATVAGNVVIAKVVDRFGNPVSGVTLYASTTAPANIGGTFVSTGVSDTSGEVRWVVSGNGSVTVSAVNPAAVAGTTFGQTCALAGNRTCAVGTTAALAFTATTAGTSLVAETGVGASLAPAGVASATVTVTQPVDAATTAGTAATAAAEAATAAAEAAADAAAEAIDAANAATDAANLSAEAADAATVAAEEARDAADAATAAVEELATQVATLMAALKAQITTLANTVAKIAKKVKA